MSISLRLKVFIIVGCICLNSLSLVAQKITNGTYFLNYIDMEYQGKIWGKCKAIVDNDKITVIVISGCHRKFGEIIEKGILIKHKSGVWIIGKSKEDKNATEIGGCRGGPTIVNFKSKRYESC